MTQISNVVSRARLSPNVTGLRASHQFPSLSDSVSHLTHTYQIGHARAWPLARPIHFTWDCRQVRGLLYGMATV